NRLWGVLTSLWYLWDADPPSLSTLCPSFCKCHNEEIIDLSDNLISTIEDSALVGLTHPRVLILNRNILSHLCPKALESRLQLSFFSLDDNPWDCDCRILCLKRLLEKSSNRRLSVSVRCSQPETRRRAVPGSSQYNIVLYCYKYPGYYCCPNSLWDIQTEVSPVLCVLGYQCLIVTRAFKRTVPTWALIS
uniref:LRRCT domain-containing protein n=1 Tax=Oncorhynchus tshawytscha TaxID=74940 RepID=A0A8C8FTE2_ONCTS